MKLQDKYNQLVVGVSGSASYADVKHVHLKKDGTVTGFVDGFRVVSDASMRIWNFIIN